MEKENLEVFIASSWGGDGLSTHHWYILENGKRIKRWTTRGYETNRKKAIEESFIRAIKHIEKKGYTEVTFYSSDMDLCMSMNLAVDDIKTASTNMKYIISKLRQYECDFQLVRDSDKRIQLAYYYTDQLLETVQRREGVSA